MKKIIISIVLLLLSVACTKADYVDISKFFFSDSQKKEFELKIENISKEIEKGNNVTENRIEKAKLLLWLHKFKIALNELESKDMPDNNPEVLFMKGFIYFEIGNDQKALDNLMILEKMKCNIDSKKKLIVEKRIRLLNSIAQNKKIAQPKWQELSNNKNCYVWNPHPKMQETVEWSGNCKNGKIDGEGVLKWNDYTLHGKAKEGFIEGSMNILYDDGTKFAGNMMKSEISGRGQWIYSSGVVFDVEYSKDLSQQIVKGRYIFPNGSKYEGNFFNERPDESGQAWCADGKNTQFIIVRREVDDRIWDIFFNCKK